MTFTRPKVGPKVYLSRGPSGHTETFIRTEADQDLRHYLGTDSRLVIATEGFLRKMMLERRFEDWSDVIGYLSEMSGLDVDLVPLNVGVAFWAHISVAREGAKAAKLIAMQGN